MKKTLTFPKLLIKKNIIMNRGKVIAIVNLNKPINLSVGTFYEYEIRFEDGYVGFLLSKDPNNPPFQVNEEIDYEIKDAAKRTIKYIKPQQQNPPPQQYPPQQPYQQPAQTSQSYQGPPQRQNQQHRGQKAEDEMKKYSRDVATYAARYATDVEIAFVKSGGQFDINRFYSNVDYLSKKMLDVSIENFNHIKR